VALWIGSPVPSITVTPSAFIARTYACLFSKNLTFSDFENGLLVPVVAISVDYPWTIRGILSLGFLIVEDFAILAAFGDGSRSAAHVEAESQRFDVTVQEC
jgi:hypothetical protein